MTKDVNILKFVHKLNRPGKSFCGISCFPGRELAWDEAAATVARPPARSSVPEMLQE